MPPRGVKRTWLPPRGQGMPIVAAYDRRGGAESQEARDRPGETPGIISLTASLTSRACAGWHGWQCCGTFAVGSAGRCTSNTGRPRQAIHQSRRRERNVPCILRESRQSWENHFRYEARKLLGVQGTLALNVDPKRVLRPLWSVSGGPGDVASPGPRPVLRSRRSRITTLGRPLLRLPRRHAPHAIG